MLIAIVAVSGFVQQRQIQGRNPSAQTNSQQQMIMKIMPFFLPVISFGLPAGLVIYFVVSNLYRIGQQAFISKSIYGVSAPDGTKSWKHLFGFGVQPPKQKSQSKSSTKGSTKGASKGSAKGSSKSSSKGSAKDRGSKVTTTSRPAKAGAARTATSGSKGTSGTTGKGGSSTGGRTTPPSTSDAQDSKRTERSSGGSGSTDQPSDSPPMQPRVRKKR